MSNRQSEKPRGSREKQARPPTARSDRTRREVLNAAAECIAQEGYAAASTVRIVERAGVSWGVLQYHFGDKASLMAAVLEYGMEQTEKHFEDIIATSNTGQTLEQRLRILVEKSWQNYSSPLARASTEVVINNRNQWRNDPDRDRYLLELNNRQISLARRAMVCATGDESLAEFLTGIFLAALHGVEADLLQYGAGQRFPQELEALVQILTSYCTHNK